MEELHSLPQIVAARTDHAYERAAALFTHLTGTIIRVEPEEAELAKLFTNSYRYIKFAAANQLYMMANDFGLDYERIRSAVVQDYPRAADLPGPGFAAGPCLLKDTMQLAAFNNNNFALGQASMQINEGLPLYLVSRMAARYDLDSMTVGILGMAFKGESDDNRSSLSYKLKRVLKVRAKAVLTTDPFVETTTISRPLSRCSIVPISSSSERPTGPMPRWPSASRSWTSGTCEATGWWCETQSLHRDPRLQRGIGHRRRARPADRSGAAAVRDGGGGRLTG